MLVQCKECKKEVSSDAKVCPYCGVKDPGVTFGMMLGAGVITVAAIALLVSYCGKSEEKSDTAAPDAPVEQVDKKDLGMTPDEFRDAYNKLASAVDKKYLMPALNVQKGKTQGAFSYTINDGVGVVGTVNNGNGKIKEITLMLAAENDGVTPLVVFLCTSKALNPKISGDENYATISEMVQQAAKKRAEAGEASLEREVGNLRYNMSSNAFTGLTFSISPQ
ncbi:MAG: zinc ribbon domain-containing protein [Zoogloeaceae bacterium]|jgi:hypothetical protein|nr:zinc ribbon domain-containing protein [Zoogloeaceae bacterium]